ncbi:MAG: YitT family protein, partial [Bacteroidales bacterium]|nr:YitT family protein [Bacteroidales bacterium]
LGSTYGPKTVVTFVATALFTDFFTFLYSGGVTGGAEKQLVAGDTLLASIYGGVLVGVGVAFIFKARATSAGTDVLARITGKLYGRQVGTLIIIIDSCIVFLGLVAFRSWEVPLYSWITIFVYGRVVDAIMDGGRTEKAIIIISEKPSEISDAILHTLGRGGTFLNGSGMYSGASKKIIYTVVHRPQIETLKAVVLQIDPGAFISVLPAYEILGKGFNAENRI